jgi:hypothetical protein
MRGVEFEAGDSSNHERRLLPAFRYRNPRTTKAPDIAATKEAMTMAASRWNPAFVIVVVFGFVFVFVFGCSWCCSSWIWSWVGTVVVATMTNAVVVGTAVGMVVVLPIVAVTALGASFMGDPVGGGCC